MRWRKNKSTSLFALIVGQSLGLDAMFGGQRADLIVGWVKSRTCGGVGKVASAGWKSRKERDELTPREAYHATFRRCQSSALTKTKKMLKIEGGPSKSMKTKGQISDKMEYPNKYLKTSELHRITY